MAGSFSSKLSCMLPSDDVIILCGFFCTLLVSILSILSNSVVMEQDISQLGIGSADKSAAQVFVSSAFNGALNMLGAAASSIPGASAVWEAPVAPLNFVAGMVFLPGLRALPTLIIGCCHRLRACSVRGRSDERPGGSPRFRISKMDWMYSVEQNARLLLNLQVRKRALSALRRFSDRYPCER